MKGRFTHYVVRDLGGMIEGCICRSFDLYTLLRIDDTYTEIFHGSRVSTSEGHQFRPGEIPGMRKIVVLYHRS